MSYIRVIPRDLFNEANLLKCLGQLYLKLEIVNAPGIELEHYGEAFDIGQSPDTGATSVDNVLLTKHCTPFTLYRPLNSREPWPLYLETEDDEEVAVFTDDGELSAEMLEFLKS